MIGKKLLISFWLFLFLLSCQTVSAESDYDNDMAVAQRCFSRSGKSRDVLPCLSRIQKYNDPRASYLKCAIRIQHQGLIFFDYPWLLNEADEYLWIAALSKISDQDLDRLHAQQIQNDCNRSDDKAAGIIGDYYYLLAIILEVGPMNSGSLKMAFPVVQSNEYLAELGEIVTKISGRCQILPDTAIFKRSILCSEALKLGQYPGENAAEQFIYGLLASN